MFLIAKWNYIFIYTADAHGGVIGCGFCKYDMTIADIDNMKELKICKETCKIIIIKIISQIAYKNEILRYAYHDHPTRNLPQKHNFLNT